MIANEPQTAPSSGCSRHPADLLLQSAWGIKVVGVAAGHVCALRELQAVVDGGGDALAGTFDDANAVVGDGAHDVNRSICGMVVDERSFQIVVHPLL
jgi:hypothetical protein